MNIREHKINNMVVRPIKHENSKIEIKGSDIIGDNLYPNVFSIAMKNSGKTTNLFNSLKKIINKQTQVYFFVSTFYNDKNYDAIRDYLDTHGIYYEAYTRIGEELNNLVEMLTLEAKQELELRKNKLKEESKDQILDPFKMTDEQAFNLIFKKDEEDNDVEELKFKIRKPKKEAPKYFIVFDDMSEDLRKSNYVTNLIKKNRHFKCLSWISSQSALDISPIARNNINIYLLYKNIPDDKLRHVYEACCLTISYDDFLELYNYATVEPYSFLYINRDTGEYRKNYNIKLDF